jgi:hypothetical protein
MLLGDKEDDTFCCWYILPFTLFESLIVNVRMTSQSTYSPSITLTRLLIQSVSQPVDQLIQGSDQITELVETCS